jgi:hypothetical protein
MLYISKHQIAQTLSTSEGFMDRHDKSVVAMVTREAGCPTPLDLSGPPVGGAAQINTLGIGRG